MKTVDYEDRYEAALSEALAEAREKALPGEAHPGPAFWVALKGAMVRALGGEGLRSSEKGEELVETVKEEPPAEFAEEKAEVKAEQKEEQSGGSGGQRGIQSGSQQGQAGRQAPGRGGRGGDDE